MSMTTAQTGARSPGRPRASVHGPAAAGSDAVVQGSIWIVFFLICVVQPFYMLLGDTALGPYRLFLVFAAVPVFIGLAQGRAGRIILPDVLVILYALWMFVAIFVNHGSAMRVPFTAAQALETTVPYFMARVLIRDLSNFRFFVRWFLRIILVLLPFALFESLTNQKLILEIYNTLPGLNVFKPVRHGQRMGLDRAQGPFEHPILFGVFCAMAFGLAWRAMPTAGQGPVQRLFWPGICVVGAFSSLSSGALVTIIIQCQLLAWDILLKNYKRRWRLFGILFVTSYVFLDLFVVDSSPLLYLISNMTFSGGSAWNRVLIWEFGSAEVLRNPIFGIGFNDWQRAPWMPASVDNYWLLVAMRYGLVGFVLHVAGILVILWRMSRIDLSLEPEVASCRSGFLISFAGASVALATVFIWSGTYSMFIFLIGSAVWIFENPRPVSGTGTVIETAHRGGNRPRSSTEPPPPDPEVTAPVSTQKSGPVYTRFKRGELRSAPHRRR